MVAELAVAEVISFLGAVLLAATASAVARGLIGHDERPLRAFQKFYLDLTAAFAGLAVLSVGGPTSWSTSPLLANVTTLEGAVSLLPIAVGLVLIALLLARHKWGRRTKRADVVATIVVAVVIIIAVTVFTSRRSAAQGLDQTAQRAFSSYCKDHSSEMTSILQLTESIDPEHRESSETIDSSGADVAEERGTLVLRIPAADYFQVSNPPLRRQGARRPAAKRQATRRQATRRQAARRQAERRQGMSRDEGERIKREFCDAVAVYMTVRKLQDRVDTGRTNGRF